MSNKQYYKLVWQVWLMAVLSWKSSNSDQFQRMTQQDLSRSVSDLARHCWYVSDLARHCWYSQHCQAFSPFKFVNNSSLASILLLTCVYTSLSIVIQIQWRWYTKNQFKVRVHSVWNLIRRVIAKWLAQGIGNKTSFCENRGSSLWFEYYNMKDDIPYVILNWKRHP